MSNLTSTLTVSLHDNVSGPAGRAAGALHKLGASGADLKKLAAASPEAARLVRELEKLQAQAGKIGAFREASRALGSAGSDFRVARQDVARLTGELGKARDAAAALKGVRGAEEARQEATATVRRLDRQLKAAQGTLEHNRGAYLAQGKAVHEMRGELTAAGVPLKGLRVAQASIERQIHDTNAELARQPARMAEAAARAEHLAQANRRAAVAAGEQLRATVEAGKASRAARQEVERSHAAKRASAGSDLAAGMGASGRVALDEIERGRARAAANAGASRRMIEGMGAPSRAGAEARAAAEADRRAAREEARARRRAGRREAAGVVGATAGVAAGHTLHRGAHASLETYREFDKERRFGRAVMGLTDEEQKPLVDQAIHMGATTKYNDVQVLEAQRELAARGLKKNQVMGLMEPAADLGQSFDLRLPDAVKQMEGAIFGFKKDISTLPAAIKSAKQTADLQVKAAKISGMTPEDITQTYKYGATPARMAGLSEETLLGFAGISKKANMGGDEAGVAFRALVANVLSPTRGAKEAMLANGMDYKNYQKMPERIDTQAFTKTVAAQYGVKLDKATTLGLEKIFTDKSLIADPSKFTPKVMELLSDNLSGDDAKSKKSIAGLANRFRDRSMQGVDADRMVADLMTAIGKNPAIANAIFGSKQGARIANALGDAETFRHMIDELANHSKGYAEEISKQRMAGFDGAVSRLKGAATNLETAAGRAFDDDGRGGLLSQTVDLAGRGVQGLAELDRKALAASVGLVALGSGVASVAGSLRLAGMFLGLPALTALGGLTAAIGVVTLAAGAAAAALYAFGDEKKGVAHGGKPDIAMNPGDELPGLPGSTDKPSWAPQGPSLPRMSLRDGVPSLVDAQREALPEAIARARDELAGYRKELVEAKSDAAALAAMGVPGLSREADARVAGLEGKRAEVEARIRSMREASGSAPPAFADAIAKARVELAGYQRELAAAKVAAVSAASSGNEALGKEAAATVSGLEKRAAEVEARIRSLQSASSETKPAIAEAIGWARDELAGYRRELAGAKADAAAASSSGNPALDVEASARVAVLEKRIGDVAARIHALREESGEAKSSLPPGAAQPTSRAAEGVPSLIDAPASGNASAIARARAELAEYKRELEVVKAEAAATVDLDLPGVGSGLDGRRAELEALVQGMQDKVRALSETSVAPKADASGLDPLDVKFGEITAKAGEVNALTIRPQADGSGLGTIISQLDTIIARAPQAKAAVNGIGSPGGGSGGAGGSAGAKLAAPAPGRQSSTGAVRRAMANNFA